jgi:heme/copper-type cytochrome/quinol oxidase subunit 3
MTDLARHSTEYRIVEEEEPEVLARNLTAAGQLLASATAFFFLAFVFAYFYLRAVNNAGLWKPKHVDASIAWGTVVTACMVGSALLVWLGYADHRADRRPAWRLKGALALTLGLVSLVLQVVAWTQQGFGPGDGGFASVYFGWTAFLFLFVLGTMFWLETVLATSIRYRGWSEGRPTEEPASRDIRDPISLVRAELASLSFYWTFLAGLAVLTWIVLYLV